MIERQVFRPAGVLTSEGLRTGLDVAVEAGRVVALGAGLPVPTAATVVELGSLLLAPGLVDLHVHELGGAGVLAASAPDVDGLAAALAVRGTTAFVATTATSSLADLLSLTAAVATHLAAEPGLGRAECLGVHLEGPWLAPSRAGAQPPEHLRAPSASELDSLLGAGPVRLLTLAPELAGSAEVIARAVAAGVVVSLGHSDASYEQAAAAVAAGARHITHCFNAMSPLHHREPGLAGAALDLTDVSVEVIADGVHLHPAVVRLLHRVVGPERLCLVSDAVDRGVRADGVLAGTATSQAAALANLVTWGVPLADAIVMASGTPARVLGRGDLGVIEVGSRADFIVLDDAARLVDTYLDGARVIRPAA